ncbi:MAG: Fic family protein, partial [Proteobacteria bacterium]|nr:Fic family protein [Pseudomonadota bacterium]
DWIKTLIRGKPHEIDEKTILDIHRFVLKGIDDENAGHYRRVPVRIAGSNAIMPNAAKVPALMEQFAVWLKSKPKLHPAELAAETHYRLVTIHPFSDGNGRTARLLMNLILMQAGYPPAIIRMQDRAAYIRSLEAAQTGGFIDDYEELIGKAVERSLDLHLKALHQKESPVRLEARQGKLLKIGELAKQAGESVPTIRFWVKEGLIDVAQRTKSRYQLFDKNMIARTKLIRKWQDQRLTLKEIEKKLAD